MQGIQEMDYYTNKEKQLNCIETTSMSDKAQKRIKDFFEKYRSLYLMPHKNRDFLEHLDRVLEQIFNFTSIKYSYDISQQDIKQAYQQTGLSILAEGYTPINQAVAIIEERKKHKTPQVTLSHLAKEALGDKIRIGEVADIVREEREDRETRDKGETIPDESSI